MRSTIKKIKKTKVKKVKKVAVAEPMQPALAVAEPMQPVLAVAEPMQPVVAVLIQAVLVAGSRAAVHRAGARAETRKADLSVGRIDLFVEVG